MDYIPMIINTEQAESNRHGLQIRACGGYANHGGLLSRHTFSFANYYNPGRVHFGALRVLNDDIVEAGKGFGTHPHDNMEFMHLS